MVRQKATDMHISAGSPPLLRVDGKLIRMPIGPISEELSKVLAYSLMSSKQRRQFEKELDIDFSIGVRGISRFRCNVFHQKGSVAIVIKAIPFEIEKVADLRIPHEVIEFGKVNRGLVIISNA